MFAHILYRGLFPPENTSDLLLAESDVVGPMGSEGRRHCSTFHNTAGPQIEEVVPVCDESMQRHNTNQEHSP